MLHRLDVDAYLVLVTSVGMLVVGSTVKRTSLIAAGCLLCGTGLGILMYAGPWNIPTANQKVLLLLCFALGWFLIPPFTRLFTEKTHWLAFVLGALMAILAGAALAPNDTLSWIMQSLLLDRSLSAMIIATDLILIGFALIIPGRRMTRNQ
jgi:hypothetical protein